MASFEKLWKESAKFRNIFVGNGRFYASMDGFDFEDAKELWENRHPFLEWNFCEVEGCKGLVGYASEILVTDKYCTKHMRQNGKLPKYVWHGKDLYKFLGVKRNGKAGPRLKQYNRLLYLIASDRYGKIKNGYKPVFVDGNYLNHRPENIFVMTRISAAALDAGVVGVHEAVEIDSLINDFVEKNLGVGPKPFRNSYDYDDIAEACGLTKGAIWKAVRDGRFDPYSLESVLEFVKNYENDDNLIRSA